jgi:signal peptidase II
MDAPQPAAQPGQFSVVGTGRYIRDHWRDYAVLFLTGGALIALDQWTKALVRANVPLGGDWLPAWLAWLLPYARIRYWYNSGAAFGFFQSGNLIFEILAIIVGGVIIYYFPRVAHKDWWLRLAMGMQFAGAVGNLIDRLIFAHVTDFISVGNFAVFNVADASISVGVAVLVLGAWITERAAKKTAASAAQPGAGEIGGPPERSESAPAAGKDEAKGE